MAEKKSVGTAAALGFFFGFFGLIYVMPVAEALMWLGGYVAFAFLTGGIGVVGWFAAPVIAIYYAGQANEGRARRSLSEDRRLLAPARERTRPVEGPRCRFCRAQIPRDASFCSACGRELQGDCPNCGGSVLREARFCTRCGSKLL